MELNSAIPQEMEEPGQGRWKNLTRRRESQIVGESWEIPSSLFPSQRLKLIETALEAPDKGVHGAMVVTTS